MVLPAYDQVLKCSHIFNLLDSRGAISVTERVGVIGRVRRLALGVADAWMIEIGPKRKLSREPAFLLEIGTEEIPDWMIVPALNNLQDMFQGLLDQQVLGGRVTSVDATPRRLVLQADGLLERQADVEELVLGPAKKAGAGAAAGFAKKMGTTPDQLGTEVTAKGEYFAFKKRTQGQATGAILARELPNLILKIQWPKTMVWRGKGTERFIRPIRWLVALLGDYVVPFEIGGVHSGNVTRGRRGLLPFTVTITDFSQKLKANGVILSADERRARIESGISAARQTRPRSSTHADLYHRVPYPDSRQF